MTKPRAGSGAASPGAGVLVVDKPQGPTSHDVVGRVRKAMRTREVGHAGTLDPMATGVLVVAVGEATKLVPWLTADDKGYAATIRLGVETDTLDAEGTETARVPIADDVRAALRADGRGARRLLEALAVERARTEQVPPAFSAIKIGGERAHVLARRGEAPIMPPRPVEVRRVEVVAVTEDDGDFALDVVLDVAKGYFVRSLARDLSRALGTVGHLTRLRRVRSGAFTEAEATPLDVPPEDLAARLLPLSVAASRALPSSTITATGVRAARFGQRLAPADIVAPHAGASAWLDERGVLVAIGEADPSDGSGKVLRGFSPDEPT